MMKTVFSPTPYKICRAAIWVTRVSLQQNQLTTVKTENQNCTNKYHVVSLSLNNNSYQQISLQFC